MAEPYPHRIPWEEIERAARRDAEVLPAAPLVSVDWDFFLPLPDLSHLPDERAELLAAGAGFYLEEWFSARRQAREWTELADRLRALGAKPEDLWSVEPRVAALDELRRRFRFRRAWVGDSHLWGACVAARKHAESGEPVELLSLDAHHDLGYLNYRGDDEERSRKRAWERPSCDDWIQAGLRHGAISRAEIVYPDWRDLDELGIASPTLPEEFEHRVSYRTFEAWRLSPAPLEHQEADLLVVRSSAYSHPFGEADRLFLELADDLAAGEWACLDCHGPLAIGAQDACRPRRAS